jgi:hypothetical protein
MYMLMPKKHDRTSFIGPADHPRWIGSERHALGRLVDWLNLQKGDPTSMAYREEGRARVREIIGLLQQLYSADAGGQARDPLTVGTTKPSHILKLQSELNRLLSPHKAVPQIFDFGDGVCSRWIPAYTNRRNVSRPQAAFFEFLFINIAMDLADTKLLSRVRLCGCGKYFVARSSLTRFCSTRCRIAFWENSDERKRRKREKAREYYLLHKAGIVKGRRKQKKSS